MNNDTKNYVITCIISGAFILFFLYLVYIPKFSNNYKQEECRIYTCLNKDNIAKLNNNFLKIKNQIEQNTRNINHIQKLVAIQQNNKIDTPSTKDTDWLATILPSVGPLIFEHLMKAKNRNGDNKLEFIVNIVLIFIVVISAYFFHYSLHKLVKKYFSWRLSK